MNSKQIAVLWVMAVLISLVSFAHGERTGNEFYNLVVPILLIGGMLVFQFGDKKEAEGRNTSAGRLGVVLLALNTTLLVHALFGGGIAAAQEPIDLSGIEGQVESVDSKADDIGDALTQLQASCVAISR